ncbi:uncharacterized mitochondrial protein AtMg00240-like [Helianthus annuus]|uniref:uncharacterized mitochondrial protein AtMg00240-like n=1 Tax=Helianthus annuus TaxID=4232 RepID=UPI000B90A00B|nr:uncharacterized mitochondrial protein AtMg00240-like [Helianthus annuus]
MDILTDCGQLGCRSSGFPMEKNLKLDKCLESHKADAPLYRRLIGRLLYLQATRPDIAYAVNVLSQFVSDPRDEHMNAALRVLRCIKSTLGQGIFIPKDSGLTLVAYCDAIGWVVLSLDARVRVICCFWEVLRYLGKQRNSQWFLVPRRKQNTVLWLLRLVKFFGSVHCSSILRLTYRMLRPSTVII